RPLHQKSFTRLESLEAVEFSVCISTGVSFLRACQPPSLPIFWNTQYCPLLLLDIAYNQCRLQKFLSLNCFRFLPGKMSSKGSPSSVTKTLNNLNDSRTPASVEPQRRTYLRLRKLHLSIFSDEAAKLNYGFSRYRSVNVLSTSQQIPTGVEEAFRR
ncbi:unnamed protein product, partial [Trichobilharzia szidati]